MPTPPTAAARPAERTLHGDRTIDEYAWLAGKSGNQVDAEVQAHLAST